MSKKRSRRTSSTSDEEMEFCSASLENKTIKSKDSRQVIVGWLCSLNGNPHKQVTLKQYGGTRKLVVSIDGRYNDILLACKSFFFKNRSSSRKIAAEEKKEIFLTGGGIPKIIKKDPCHDVVLSIMNTKSVFGLDNGGLDRDGIRPKECLGNQITGAGDTTTDTVIEFKHMDQEIEDDMQINREISDNNVQVADENEIIFQIEEWDQTALNSTNPENNINVCHRISKQSKNTRKNSASSENIGQSANSVL
ncbi:unnamed protein product [Ceutorhynchus assimilis]|uniref:Uncharacterized protein n=1 Tax=Ceutorhynchus assimilis TaxID=467358 RepID=A0A9N9MVB4_9CUCU|nr:unnamed protein product [Ceutorhynchus assimilis]